MKTSILKTFSLVLILCGCETKTRDNNVIDGVWQSIGYGRLVKIDSGEFLLADVSNSSCTPSMSGEISMFEDNIGVTNDTLWLKDGINLYQFTRLEDAPQVCKADLSEAEKNSPTYNFKVLCEIFSDHYAYFKERNIDWVALQSKYKAKVTDDTTNAELYTIMAEMLDVFNDGHIGLSAPREVESAAEDLIKHSEEISEEPKRIYRRREVANAVVNHYFKDVISKNGGVIRWGILENNIGYLQINQMMGYANYVPEADTLDVRDFWKKYFEAGENKTPSQHTKDELAGLNTFFGEAMTDLNDTQAIIIDVRFNGGGKDEIGITILSHFNNKERIVFSKKAKMGDGHTKNNVIKLASNENPYTNPVYLLIGDGSASATEIMTLSSLQLDNVTRIGSHTNGVFSDILEKTLPNGWELGLSNEVYLDTKGNNYEGVGIAPDIDMGYDKDIQKQYTAIMESLENDGDKAIETVLQLQSN